MNCGVENPLIVTTWRSSIFWGLCRILEGVHRIFDGVCRILDGVRRILERSFGQSGGCMFCHRWCIRRSQQCAVGRQCTTSVLSVRCQSQFQICVCVSGLVSLLSVSMFSLHKSASKVAKSLRCSAGASCQSRIKTRTAVCSYIEQPRVSCTETEQRF